MSEYLEKISVNTRYLILLIFTVFFAFFVYMQFISPLRDDTQKVENQLLQVNTRLAAIQTFAVQNKDYDSFLKIQTLKVEEAKKKLPDTVTIPELVAEYSKLAMVNKVVLESLKPPTEVKPDKGGAFAVPLKLTLSGDYFNLVEFLQQVEKGNRFTTIESVDFSSDGKGSLKMNADFVVYTLNNPKQAAASSKATAAKQAPEKKN
ncbi:MAG: type 4a pilus biogenesis protein PilO [Acidaminococcaceae bacterium]